MKPARTLAEFGLDRGNRWVRHKKESQRVMGIYLTVPAHRKEAERIRCCAENLKFKQDVNSETGEVKFTLISAMFCRVRYCPICQWRRTLRLLAIFYQNFPTVITRYPSAKFVFLTLTVENCPLSQLREIINYMNKAWGRLTKCKEFVQVIGWIRTTQVKKAENGEAHPHFHCLLMVPSSYYGNNFIKRETWSLLWKAALKVNYKPEVDASRIKPTGAGFSEAVRNVFAYSVRPEDMISDPDWFITLTEQTSGLHFLAKGGELKRIMKSNNKAAKMPNGQDVGATELLWDKAFLWDGFDKDYNSLDIISGKS